MSGKDSTEPPLLVENKLVTDFLDKANLFNEFFVKQSIPISNHSTVPVNINLETRERLSSLEFCVDKSLPQNWKKANIIPVHKIVDKQLIPNCRAESLLPICGKVFEKIIFTSLFVYLDNDNLFNSNPSDFRPSDSCKNQIILQRI